MVLVKHGIAEDAAASMSRPERIGRIVILGELEGGKFDWSSGCWKEKK